MTTPGSETAQRVAEIQAELSALIMRGGYAPLQNARIAAYETELKGLIGQDQASAIVAAITANTPQVARRVIRQLNSPF